MTEPPYMDTDHAGMFYKEQTMVDIQEQLGMLVNEHRKVVAELKRLKAYSKFLSDEVVRKGTETNRLRLALESIADNTCCEGCQEAAKVAFYALTEKHEDTRACEICSFLRAALQDCSECGGSGKAM